MAETMMIQGKVETIFDERDFAELLRTRLGSDAEDFFNRCMDPEALYDAVYEKFSADPLKYCSGECTKTYELQQFYEDRLKEIELAARELYKCYMAKPKVPRKEMDIVLDLIKKVVAAQ